MTHLDYYYHDYIIMACSFCGAEGTNKTTCPHNPNATGNVNPAKHNATTSTTVAASKPKTVAAAAAKPKPKPIAAAAAAVVVASKPKPVASKPKPVASKPAPVAASNFVQAAEAEAMRLFPDNLDLRQEYVADALSLGMPRVTTGDKIDRRYAETQKEKQQRRADISTKCANCQLAIKGSRSYGADIKKWGILSSWCQACADAIQTHYHSNFPEKDTYKKYHKGNLPIDVIERVGGQNNYYNSTMYDAAQTWVGNSSNRMIAAAPKVPR